MTAPHSLDAAIRDAVRHVVLAHYLWIESVLTTAVEDGFRGWVEIDDPYDPPTTPERSVWRHNHMPARPTGQRGRFFNMASIAAKASA